MTTREELEALLNAALDAHEARVRRLIEPLADRCAAIQRDLDAIKATLPVLRQAGTDVEVGRRALAIQRRFDANLERAFGVPHRTGSAAG